MTCDTGQGLQADIKGIDPIQHPDRMNIVTKMTACVLVIQFVQKHLAAMGKGCMTNIVTQSNGFDQVQIQMQRTADGSGNS